MTDRVVDILETTTTIPMFAVGLAHWIQGGTNSMENLLNQKGYTLQRVEGLYDSTLLPDWTDTQCDEQPTVAGAGPSTSDAIFWELRSTLLVLVGVVGAAAGVVPGLGMFA